MKHDYLFHPLTDIYGGAAYSVEDIMEEIDRFYVLAKLHLINELKNQEVLFSRKIPIQFFEETIDASQKYKAENPVFTMYRNALDLHDPKKAKKALLHGIKLLKINSSAIGQYDQAYVLLCLRNYAIRELNKGKTDMSAPILDIYKLGLKLNLIVKNGKIAETTFVNIVQIGCIAKDYEWTEEFIHTHESYLKEEIKEGTTKVSFGTLYFHKKEYDRALEYFDNQGNMNAIHKITARVSNVKTWFEKFLLDSSLYEILISNLNAHEKYYRRNSTVSKQKNEACINFILAAKLLVDIFLDKNQPFDKRKLIENYISGNVAIVSKKWLIEKYVDMK